MLAWHKIISIVGWNYKNTNKILKNNHFYFSVCYKKLRNYKKICICNIIWNRAKYNSIYWTFFIIAMIWIQWCLFMLQKRVFLVNVNSEHCIHAIFLETCFLLYNIKYRRSCVCRSGGGDMAKKGFWNELYTNVHTIKRLILRKFCSKV